MEWQHWYAYYCDTCFILGSLITITILASLCSENWATSSDPKHRAFIVESYFHEKSWSRFNNFQRSFWRYGHLINRPLKELSIDGWKCSGNSCDIVTQEIIERVCAHLQANAHTSLHHAECYLNISTKSTHQIVEQNLQLRSYQCSLLQGLKPTDYDKWLVFCCWFRFICNDFLPG